MRASGPGGIASPRVAVKPWSIAGAHLRVRPCQKIVVVRHIDISKGRRLARGSCPFFGGGNAAALEARIRKILKNDALAVILP